MVSVTTTFSLQYDLWEKSRRYRLNRSEIARKAIAQAVQEIEGKDTPVSSCQTAGGSTSFGGQKE